VLARILDVAIQFAWGLGFAHEKGLIHQDVKPANLLLTPEGTAKVTDFGLARGRVLEDMTVPDGEGGTVVVRGTGSTPAYCSPQQARGETLNRRTDHWSWGLSVLEMFSGGPFWIRPEEPLLAVGQLAPQALAHYLEHGPEDERIPAMPEGLVELLSQCFQADPADRPGNFEEIAERLILVFPAETEQAYSRQPPKAGELLAGGLNNRALSLFDLGRPDEALQLFDSALEADPLHLEATYNRGLQLWRSGKLTDDVLVQQLEEIRKAHQDDWRDEYYLGLVHLERGDVKSAAEVLEEASAQAPEQDEVHRALAEARESPAAKVAEIARARNYREISSVAVSPDGASGLTATSAWIGDYPATLEHRLCLWNLATRQLIRPFKGHTENVTSVAIGPDGCLALSGSHDKTLRLWELPTGRCVRVFTGHKDQVRTVTISPNGQWALSGGEETLRFWEIATGRCLRVLKPKRSHRLIKRRRRDKEPTPQRDIFGKRHEGRIDSVAFTPDGRLGLSGGWEALRIWELESGRCIGTIEGTVNTLAVTPDGLFALLGSGGTLRLVELETQRCIWTFKDRGHGKFDSIAISQDGHFALTSSRVLRQWELATGRCLRTLDLGKTEKYGMTFDSIAITPDGSQALLATYGLHVQEIPDVGRPATWAIAIPRSVELIAEAQTAVLKATHEVRLNLERGFGSAAALAVAEARAIPGYERDPALLALSLEVCRLGKSRELSDAWIVERYREHTENIDALAVTVDGRSVLSASRDGTLHLWELETGKCSLSWRYGTQDPKAMRKAVADQVREGRKVNWSRLPLHSGKVTAIAVSPDGHFALTGSHDKTLRLWELASGRFVRSFEGHEHSVTRVAISPDGQFACSFSWGKLRVWDMASGRCVRTFQAHGLHVTALAISPDGCSVIAGGETGDELCIWEIASGQCLRTLEHKSPVSVAITSDGRSAVSKGYDGTLKLWDLASGKCIRDIEHPASSKKLMMTESPVSISPDGRYVLSSFGSKLSCLLELATGNCVHTFPNGADFIEFGLNGRFVMSSGKSLWSGELDWEYEFPETADWDDGARPFLESFLTLHTPYAGDWPRDREPTEEEVQAALTRGGTPSWTENEFQLFLADLGYRGYGWLRPDGVRQKLAELARSRQGPE